MNPDEGMIEMWNFQMKALKLFSETKLPNYLSTDGKSRFDEGLATIEELLADPGIEKMVSDAISKQPF